MAQYNITIDSEILHYLFLKGAKDEGMAKLLESVLNQVLQAQATEQIKAEPYERTKEREDYRNGYYKRGLDTRVGNIVLQIPRFRYGKFTTDLFQRYQRSEQALLLALMEMVVNGVSTRKVEEITYELCGTEFSRSTKDEGEITGGKRLIRKLYEKFHHFADVIVTDALYCKASWIKEVLAIGMDAVVRVKDERLHIVKDALGLFQSREANKQWIVNEGSTKKIIVSAWDDDGFEMTGMDIKVRFIRFLEEIHEGDKKELKEVWIVTTNKNICTETIWR